MNKFAFDNCLSSHYNYKIKKQNNDKSYAGL